MEKADLIRNEKKTEKERSRKTEIAEGRMRARRVAEG